MAYKLTSSLTIATFSSRQLCGSRVRKPGKKRLREVYGIREKDIITGYGRGKGGKRNTQGGKKRENRKNYTSYIV